MSDGSTHPERTNNPDRTASAARASIAEMLPGAFLTDKSTGERVYFSGGLSPRQVAPAWRQGLKDAGAEDVKTAQAHLGGGKFKTLPLVVQFSCPFDHLDDTGEGWAKVRLKVNPFSGWVSIHEDSCLRCTQEQIEAWLITCPRCAAGVAEDEHLDHDDPEAWCLFCASCSDQSPIAYVIEAMWEYERGEVLLTETKKKPPHDVASAKQWLASLTTEDGSELVAPTLGQAAVWDLVKSIPGCPNQSLVRKAQAERKAEAAGTG